VFKFLAGKPLWVNILVAIVLVFVIIVAFLFSLDYFTQHGKVMRIPAVAGKTLSEATKQLEKEGFEVIIQDSVYEETLAPLAVVKQFPEADEFVKVNRTVYLTVNRSVAPTIEMPNLVGMSFRNAELVLKQYGLKLGDTTFRPDFAKNSILSQVYNEEEIKPSAKLPMGSTISLILGSGLANTDMIVPDLFGLSYAEAKTLLDSTGVSFGAVVASPDVKESANAFIYKQSPERLTEDKRVNRIRPGQMIDIWLSTEKPVRNDTTVKAPD
jgi:eukaryotic-like serine/threonine-protein kinase